MTSLLEGQHKSIRSFVVATVSALALTGVTVGQKRPFKWSMWTCENSDIAARKGRKVQKAKPEAKVRGAMIKRGVRHGGVRPTLAGS